MLLCVVGLHLPHIVMCGSQLSPSVLHAVWSWEQGRSTHTSVRVHRDTLWPSFKQAPRTEPHPGLQGRRLDLCSDSRSSSTLCHQLPFQGCGRGQFLQPRPHDATQTMERWFLTRLAFVFLDVLRLPAGCVSFKTVPSSQCWGAGGSLKQTQLP